MNIFKTINMNPIFRVLTVANKFAVYCISLMGSSLYLVF